MILAMLGGTANFQSLYKGASYNSVETRRLPVGILTYLFLESWKLKITLPGIKLEANPLG